MSESDKILKAAERERARLEKEAAKIIREMEREQAQRVKADAAAARSIAKAARDEQKAMEAAEKAVPKPEPTEEELVLRYANRTIKNQLYHGRVDSSKFKGLEHTHSVNKKLWFDTDFLTCVVWQSQEQKMEFYEKSGWPVNQREQCQIINGLELAKLMGITLREETRKAYPTGNLDLMPLVLDNWIIYDDQPTDELQKKDD